RSQSGALREYDYVGSQLDLARFDYRIVDLPHVVVGHQIVIVDEADVFASGHVEESIPLAPYGAPPVVQQIETLDIWHACHRLLLQQRVEEWLHGVKTIGDAGDQD